MTQINSQDPSIQNVEDTSHHAVAKSNNNNVEDASNRTVVGSSNNEVAILSQNKLAQLVTDFFLPQDGGSFPKVTEGSPAKKTPNLDTLQLIVEYLRTTPHTEMNLNEQVNGIPLLSYLLEIAIVTKRSSSFYPENKLLNEFNSEFSSLFQKKEFILTCNWNQPATKDSADYRLTPGHMPVHSIVLALGESQDWSIQLSNTMLSLTELKVDWSASVSKKPSALAMIVGLTLYRKKDNSLSIHSTTALFLKEYLKNTPVNKIDLKDSLNGVSFLTYFIEIVKFQKISNIKQQEPHPSQLIANELCDKIIEILNHESVFRNCEWNRPQMRGKLAPLPDIPIGTTSLHALTSALDQKWASLLLAKLIDAKVPLHWLKMNVNGHTSLSALVKYFLEKNSQSDTAILPILFLKPTETTALNLIIKTDLSFRSNGKYELDLNKKAQGIPLLLCLIEFANLIQAYVLCNDKDPLITRLHGVIINLLGQNPSTFDWNQQVEIASSELTPSLTKTPLHSLIGSASEGQKWAFELFKRITANADVQLNWSTMLSTNETPLWKLIHILYKQEFAPGPIPFTSEQMDHLSSYLHYLIKNISNEPNKKNPNMLPLGVDIWDEPVEVESTTYTIFGMISDLTTKGKIYPQLLLDLMCNPYIPLGDFPLVAKNVKSGFINTLLGSTDKFIQAIGYAFIVLKPRIGYQGSISGNPKIRKKIEPLLEAIYLAAEKINAFECARSHEKEFLDKRLKTQMIVDGITDFFDSLPHFKALPPSYLRKIIQRAYLGRSFGLVVFHNWDRPEYKKIDHELSLFSYKVAAIISRNAYLNVQSSSSLSSHFTAFLLDQNNNNNEAPARKRRKSNPFQACSTALLDLFYEVLIELRDEKALPSFLDFSQRQAISKTAEKFPHLSKETKNDFKQEIRSALSIHNAIIALREDGTLNILKLNDEIREIVKTEAAKISSFHHQDELTAAIKSKILMLSNSAQSLSANMTRLSQNETNNNNVSRPDDKNKNIQSTSSLDNTNGKEIVKP